MPLKICNRFLLATVLFLALPALSTAQISLNISVGTPPPELPVYDQPPIPGDGYLWVPGYWAWSDDIQDYYWVPGTWVLAPQPGYLWTPGYWGWQDGVFLWNPGYWGLHVGFYGGVNYGFGYGGSGFEGGYWQGGHLYYNRSVTNISTTNITNVYNKTVINNVSAPRVGYNGGTGGVRASPTAAEQAVAREPHIAAVPSQRQQEAAARSNPGLRASQNHGRPSVAATARPGAFSGPGVVAAKRGGAVSPIHSNPAIHPAQPENRPAQPESRPSQPQNRQAQPQSRPAPAPAPRPEQPAAEQRRSEPAPRPEQPAAEQRRPPQPAQPPRPAPKPQAAPRPEEHPQEHRDEHEH